jgi:hypothetical protein
MELMRVVHDDDNAFAADVDVSLRNSASVDVLGSSGSVKSDVVV